MSKKKYFIVLFITLSFTTLNAQPYYYTSTYEPFPYGHHSVGDMYRINMNNPAEAETLLTNVYDLGSTFSDEYGNWIAYEEGLNLKIMNLNNPTQENVISEYSEGTIKLAYAGAENKLVLLYLGIYPNPYKLVLVDPMTLTITDSIPHDIHWDCNREEDIIFSQSGNVMYLMKTDTILHKGYIASYSLSSKQIVASKYIEDLSESGADEFFFNFRRNGLSVIESLFLSPTPTSYYRIYFLDKDSLSIPIIRDDSQSWADGYVASEGDYLLLFNNLLNSDSIGFTYTGKIEIYDMTDGELKKTIQLPSDGEVMCFENYPNNVYYTKDIELPTRQVWVLKMDSIFNVLDLTSLDPSSEIVNSPPFTLTVNGYGFDTLSTVYFNDTAKTTTFISDSVLTAEISTSDISVVGNYPVWVTDEWGTSDTLTFPVVPQPPVLTSISPSLALPVSYYTDNTDFTVTATGTNFNDSSVIYFDGSIKTTTYVSDSVLTFQLNNYNDISSSNDYSVWVSSYGSNSDTLYFSVVDSLPQSLAPVVNCVRNNGDRTFTAFFGYNNSNNESVFISIGGDNYFNPIQLFADRGQPNIFLPGIHSSVFSVVFDGNNLIWNLNGTSATANKQSTPCP